jgi:hypothetical protein
VVQGHAFRVAENGASPHGQRGDDHIRPETQDR